MGEIRVILTDRTRAWVLGIFEESVAEISQSFFPKAAILSGAVGISLRGITVLASGVASGVWADSMGEIPIISKGSEGERAIREEVIIPSSSDYCR